MFDYNEESIHLKPHAPSQSASSHSFLFDQVNESLKGSKDDFMRNYDFTDQTMNKGKEICYATSY